MQFRALETGIEVNGRTVYAVVDGFGAFKESASRILAKLGIGAQGKDGLLQIDPDGWYSQEAWLAGFEKISASGGDSILFRIGHKIPQNAAFPPWVQDVESAIKSIDIAYHMNHRKKGQVMFDPATGKMLEGIGHYGWERVSGKNEIVVRCDNPYPCEFDRGIVTAMAQRFAPNARIVHQPERPCRKDSANVCTYVVQW